jgi:dienelactone hydrolase
MHYFVSLPAGWNRSRRWPVVVVITDAYREFAETARNFATERASRPFIIVVPLVLTGGPPAAQHVTDFDYGPAEWSYADSVGACRFDDDGLAAILRDVQQRDNGDDRVFITGWESGGHVVIAQLLEHPERLRAAVAVTPNSQGRCVSSDRRVGESWATMPVRIFHGADDAAWAAGQPLYTQWFRVDTATRLRGFSNVLDTTIVHQGHGSLAAHVLSYLAGLLPR